MLITGQRFQEVGMAREHTEILDDLRHLFEGLKHHAELAVSFFRHKWF